MATSRRFFDGAQEELGSLPIEATSQPTPPTPETIGINFFWVKDSGTWRRCIAYLNESGTYSYVKPYIKVSGTWK